MTWPVEGGPPRLECLMLGQGPKSWREPRAGLEMVKAFLYQTHASFQISVTFAFSLESQSSVILSDAPSSQTQ